MAVKLLKLASGEEIIADVETDPSDVQFVNLRKPVQVGLSPNGVGFAPFMPLSDEAANGSGNFEIRESCIMIEATPLKELLNEYNARFGSGLVLP
jgi:hypothetical protein